LEEIMTRIEKDIVINASAEKVFDILDDPNRASEMNPDLTLLSYTPAERGGYDNTWEYKMAGMKFAGESHMKAYEKPRLIVFETTGGIPSRWEWTLEPQGPTTTRVSLSLDYTMPGSLVGAIANKLVVERQNEKAIENQLANLKRMSESS
jgi:uncharacterized membrane protein